MQRKKSWITKDWERMKAKLISKNNVKTSVMARSLPSPLANNVDYLVIWTLLQTIVLLNLVSHFYYIPRQLQLLFYINRLLNTILLIHHLYAMIILVLFFIERFQDKRSVIIGLLLNYLLWGEVKRNEETVN